MHFNKIILALAAAGFATGAYATNGMNLEAYGPIAGGMGGAAFAYDNGNAGMMNNPATLGLVADGSNRLDVAVGFLGPDVTASMTGMPDAESGGDAYVMPAIGWSRKTGKLTYGAGLFAQGGMGTEYGDDTFISGYESMTGSMGMSGQEARSELGVGRVLVPLAYDVTDKFIVGGSLDFVWGGLDLMMPMGGSMFADLLGTHTFGEINMAKSTLIQGLGSQLVDYLGGSCDGGEGNYCITDVNYAAFDFSNGDGFSISQQLEGTGFAGKLGFVWKATPTLQVGATYHSKTNMSDLEGDGKLIMSVEVEGVGTVPQEIKGKLSVVDFQWPETYGVGVAWQATDKLLLVADYKRINWADVMKDFHMVFTADGSGAVMDVTLYQEWDDQDVFMIGGAYKATDALTLRAGYNYASNPIPDEYLNPLFPATVEQHFTVGFGYAFNKVSDVNFSLTYAPETEDTNPNMGVEMSHAQTNWQLMYSHRF